MIGDKIPSVPGPPRPAAVERGKAGAGVRHNLDAIPNAVEENQHLPVASCGPAQHPNRAFAAHTAPATLRPFVDEKLAHSVVIDVGVARFGSVVARSVTPNDR